MGAGGTLSVGQVDGGLLVGRGQFLVVDDGLGGDFAGDLLVLGLLHLVGIEVLLLIPANTEVIFLAGWIGASKPGIPYTLLPVPCDTS